MANIQLVYNEKDIEDILVEDCPHFIGLKYIRRQFRIPVGIIDILAKGIENRGTYYVVEIKKGKLDASAFAQVLRYSQWLTSEFSKDGRRAFIPLLIGQELGDDIVHLCEYFEPEEHPGVCYYGRVFYRLFDFCPRSGVTFTWYNNIQRRYRESLVNGFHPYSRLEMDLSDAQYELYCREQAEALGTSHPLPMLVK